MWVLVPLSSNKIFCVAALGEIRFDEEIPREFTA